MTVTLTTADPTSPHCGIDCVYLDGACRCYHAEPATWPLPASVIGVEPPY
jgi:hypothetical protein